MSAHGGAKRTSTFQSDFEGWRLICDRHAASRPQRFNRFDAGALFLPPPIWKTT